MRPIDNNGKVTDVASQSEMLNGKVKLMEGTNSNKKITTPIDLKIEIGRENVGTQVTTRPGRPPPA